MKILVANKIDLTNQRIISKEDGLEIAKKYGLQYFEVSAKTGEGVIEMYDSVIA